MIASVGDDIDNAIVCQGSRGAEASDGKVMGEGQERSVDWGDGKGLRFFMLQGQLRGRETATENERVRASSALRNCGKNSLEREGAARYRRASWHGVCSSVP